MRSQQRRRHCRVKRRETAPLSLDLRTEGITAVIWATGYRDDYSWTDAPVCDEHGYPQQHRGVTAEPGLYFIGLHGMHTAG